MSTVFRGTENGNPRQGAADCFYLLQDVQCCHPLQSCWFDKNRDQGLHRCTRPAHRRDLPSPGNPPGCMSRLPRLASCSIVD
ncbi:hypothetical protein WJX74_002619 [Apatococcus lobatus]|uniref:Uncharacterized protein n=1 Tax=Apatococcus lobatus TaxID=904363 RepID=A0AAW1RQT6_9CHLO